jgi:hypothetical protein
MRRTSLIESDYPSLDTTGYRCCASSGWPIGRINIFPTTDPVFGVAEPSQNTPCPTRPAETPHLNSCLPPTRSTTMGPSGTPRGDENP